jgi:hypothetical protein
LALFFIGLEGWVEDPLIQRDAGPFGEVLRSPSKEQAEVRDPIPLVVVLQLPQEAVAAAVQDTPEVALRVVMVQYVLALGNRQGAQSTSASL